MAEPTLGEIDGGRIDPEIGTGQPAVIYDDSQLLRSINENAQFKAQNDWNKYKQFLGDYETRLKNQQEIADKEVSEADREYLKKRSVELFKGIANDPYKIYSPEFNTELSGLRADATASKTDRDFAEKNAEFMMLHPEWATDENKKALDDYRTNQTLEKGGRKQITLNLPDQMDYMKYFDLLKESPDVKSVYNKNIDKGDGVFADTEFTKYDRKKFLGKVATAYDSDARIKAKADRDFAQLPSDMKTKFGDAKGYWNEFGAKHFLSGEDIEIQGKEVLKGTPNFGETRKMTQEDKRIAIAQQNANANTAHGKKQMELIDKQIKAFEKTGDAGEDVDYWGARIAPQLPSIKDIKEKKDRKWWFTGDDYLSYPSDYTGESQEMPASTIADLDVLLTDEKDENNKPLTVTDKTKIKIKYEKGKAVGIIIKGRLYDATAVNRKAIQLHNRSVTNKTDLSPLIGIGASPKLKIEGL